MASSDAIEFYKQVRSSSSMWADLAAQQDQEALIARIGVLSSKQGFSLSEEEIRGSVDSFDMLIQEAANDDELTDDELEFVAAGSTSVCQSGGT